VWSTVCGFGIQCPFLNTVSMSFFRRYLEEPCLWVETNNTTLRLLSSNAEIALGFLLIISLFSYAYSDFRAILKLKFCLRNYGVHL
jgi:hypothetical protein